jgi:hypothetical protein
MKSKAIKEYSARELDRMALDSSDVKPMSASMRRKWEAAKQTGKRLRRGRPQKTATVKSTIVPVSLDPSLLFEADRYGGRGTAASDEPGRRMTRRSDGPLCVAFVLSTGLRSSTRRVARF